MNFYIRISAVVLGLTATFHGWATPFTEVSGKVSGAAWNRMPGEPYQCSYYQPSAGSCGYAELAFLNENSTSGTWNGLQNSFVGLVKSSVDDSGLRAYADIAISNYPIDFINPNNHYGSSFIMDAWASATMYDYLTITGPGTGPIQVSFTLDVGGGVYRFGAGAAWVDVAVFSPVEYAKWGHLGVPMPVGGVVHEVLTTPALTFFPGQAKLWGVNMKAFAQVSSPYQATLPQLVTASALADFEHTLKIAGITLTNVDGTPLSGYTIQSQSGFDFNRFLPPTEVAVDPSPVPEPASFLPMTAGVIGLAWARVRRSRRERPPSVLSAARY